jgi:hypothetical protein
MLLQLCLSTVTNYDIQIYMFRLLLEYARIIDDNRESIGYTGDGRELESYDLRNPFPL